LRFGWFFQRTETSDTCGDIPLVMALISASEVAKLSLGESQRSRSIIESHMDGLALSRSIRRRLPWDVVVRNWLQLWRDSLSSGGEVIMNVFDLRNTGEPYQTLLDPPPGPPADEHGNFLPLPESKPGHPKPPNWPSHIHLPKEVAEHDAG